MKILFAVCVLGAAVAFATLGGDTEEPLTHSPDQNVQQVSTFELHPTIAQDVVLTFGQVRARWSVSLKSEVSGRVLNVTGAALVGSRVEEGTLLAVIEDTAQRFDVANRAAEQVTAKRAVIEERKRALIAEENWKTAGYESDPDPLVLRVPQLEEAEAKLQSAELALTRAKYMLEQTRIRAPFNGAITRRLVSPGDYIQAGTDIVEIYDTSHLEVVLPMTEAEVSRLGGALGTAVVLSSDETGQNWQGVVDRIDQQVDTKNRWINLIVSIGVPDGLRPGQFLRAEVKGQIHTNVLGIPQNLISRDGAVWQVDDQNRLRRLAMDPLFSQAGVSVVRPDPDWPPVLRLTPPSTSYLEGRRVRPEAAATDTPIHPGVNGVGQ